MGSILSEIFQQRIHTPLGPADDFVFVPTAHNPLLRGKRRQVGPLWRNFYLPLLLALFDQQQVATVFQVTNLNSGSRHRPNIPLPIELSIRNLAST